MVRKEKGSIWWWMIISLKENKFLLAIPMNVLILIEDKAV